MFQKMSFMGTKLQTNYFNRAKVVINFGFTVIKGAKSATENHK
jgi:hypothetical protein